MLVRDTLTGRATDDGYTRVRLAQPVPIDIASCIFTALGQRFPGTTIATAESGGTHMTLCVPDSDRIKAVDLVGQALEGIEPAEAVNSDETCDMYVRHDGSITTTPAQHILATIVEACADILDEAQAPNYVEMLYQVDGQAYTVTVGRDNGKSAHTLRLHAEERAETAQAALQATRDELDEAHTRAAAADARIAQLEAELAAKHN